MQYDLLHSLQHYAVFIIAFLHDSAFILCLFFHPLHLGSKGGLFGTHDPLKLHADFLCKRICILVR